MEFALGVVASALWWAAGVGAIGWYGLALADDARAAAWSAAAAVLALAGAVYLTSVTDLSPGPWVGAALVPFAVVVLVFAVIEACAVARDRT